MPQMQHPDSRTQINAAPEQVPMYASQGWQAVAAKAPAKRAAKKPAAPSRGAAK